MTEAAGNRIKVQAHVAGVKNESEDDGGESRDGGFALDSFQRKDFAELCSARDPSGDGERDATLAGGHEGPWRAVNEADICQPGARNISRSRMWVGLGLTAVSRNPDLALARAAVCTAYAKQTGPVSHG